MTEKTILEFLDPTPFKVDPDGWGYYPSVPPFHVNLFHDSPALLELQPHGDATIPVAIAADQAAELLALLVSPETSAALAALFLAGVTVGERTARNTSTRA